MESEEGARDANQCDGDKVSLCKKGENDQDKKDDLNRDINAQGIYPSVNTFSNENFSSNQTDQSDQIDSTPNHKDKKSDSAFKMPTFGTKSGFKIKSSLPSPGNVLKSTEKHNVKHEIGDKKVENTEHSHSISKESGDNHNVNNKESLNSGTKIVKDKNVSQQSPKLDKLKALSPAEQLKEANISVPYKEPSWGGIADKQYSFEVLKNGQIIDNIDLTVKSFHVCGRLPSCDLTMEHPSLSRHHAVIQYCAVSNDKYPVGWYLYDLDSTHGTWANKAKLKPKVYYRLRVGYVLKFGGSSRLYILQGPDEDQGPESELSLTEMKELREKQKKTAEILRQVSEDAENEEEKQEEAEDEGCSWGMDKEDAVDPDLINPFSLDVAADRAEELYLEDPKKTLRGWFEREGYDLPEYEAEEVSYSKYRCRLELPLDTVTGEPIIAEAVVAGKKKEAVAACALEACRILDRHGVLRQAQHESRKKKKKDWEKDDFYDSDDDTFLDRTGAIEKKRAVRMKRVGKTENKSETYQSLVDKLSNVEKEIESVEKQLERAKAEKEARDLAADEDALDVYMSAIKSGAMDTKTKIKLKSQLFELRKEEQKLRKLANIARPASMPELKKSTTGGLGNNKSLPMFGKMKSRTPRLPVIGPSKPVQQPNKENADFVEEEDEEEDEAKKASIETRDENSSSQLPTCHEVPLTKHTKNSLMDEEESTKTDDCTMDVTPDQQGGAEVITADKSESIDDTSLNRRADAIQKVKIDEEKKTAPPSDVLPKKRQQTVAGPHKMKKSRENVSKEYCNDDPDYAVWVPPTGQTGDGRTHLNEKFGY